MRKSILFWLTFALAVLVTLYFVVRIYMAAMGMGGIAPTGKISVNAGRGSISARDIAETMRIPAGRPAYSVNIERALVNISAMPDIKSAAVRRMPNGKIAVRVLQRDIVAAWTDGLNFYPLADDGRPVKRPLDERPTGTLVFSGELPGDVGKVAGIIKSAPNVFAETAQMEWVEGRRWNLYTNSGIKIMMPESDFAGAVARLSERQKQSQILNRDISVLDLRDAERTLVKLK